MSAPRITRRSLIAGGLLASAALAANSRRPDRAYRMLRGERIDPLFPKKIGDWVFETSAGLVLPSAEEHRDRHYSNLITRYYSSPTRPPVMLLIAYSDRQDGLIQVHRPEACYPAAGYEIRRQRIIPLDVDGISVPARFLSTESASRAEQLIYWTRIGDGFPARWWAQHLAVARENLKGRVPDGVLIRISTSAPDDRHALSTLGQFISRMMAALSPDARRLLFGEAALDAADLS